MSSKRPNDVFCPVPFLMMTLYPTGDVAACCRLPLSVLGNIKDRPLAELWNDAKLKTLRREFLSGDIKMCKRAVRDSGCHLWHEHLLDKVQLTEHQNAPIRKLDVRLNGQCNLECVMCTAWQEPNGTYEGSDFWTSGPTRIFPHLVELELLGGEPFIQKDTFRLIDEVSAVNADVSWLFTTNAQWKLTAGVKERLDRIRIRRIIVSLDSFEPETYAEIRRPGKLERALENLRVLRDYRDERARRGRGFDLTVCMAVQRRNADEVALFLEQARALGVGVSFIHVQLPHQNSLSTLPRRKRALALAQYESLRDKMVAPELAPLIEALKATLDAERLLENAANDLILREGAQ